jgi:hypothetical protein
MRQQGRIDYSIAASLVVLAVIAGLWLYMAWSRVALDRRIAEVDRAIAAETARAPFTTLEAYDAAERRGELQQRRDNLDEVFPLEALVYEARQSLRTAHKPPAWRKAHEMTMELRGRAEVAEAAAAEQRFGDSDLNLEAMRAIGEWRLQVGHEKLAEAAGK